MECRERWPTPLKKWPEKCDNEQGCSNMGHDGQGCLAGGLRGSEPSIK